MGSFASVEELFDAITDLIGRLEAGNLPAPAAELRAGFRCLNGLTDGWALLLESVESVVKTKPPQLAPEDRRSLRVIEKEVRRIVYRK